MVPALEKVSTLSWGGYVESGSGFTQASGYFYIPSSIAYVSSGDYVSNGPCSLPPGHHDRVVYWVGIGGVAGPRNLWQAGVCHLPRLIP